MSVINDATRVERQVLGESALLGERVVSIIRLVLTFVRSGIFFGMLGTGSAETPVEWWRQAALFGYMAFSLGSPLVLFRWKRYVRRQYWVPFLATTFDVGFLLVMGAPYAGNAFNPAAYPEFAVLGFGLFLCFALARPHWIHAAYSTVLCSGAYLYAVARLPEQVQFQGLINLYVVSSYAILGVLIGWVSRDMHRRFVDLRRRDALAKFLPPQIVERVLTFDRSALAPVQREVTVLFLDIRDFTTLSEKLPPQEVLAFLDGFFSRMGAVVKAHGGIVNKFLGDGMLAFWGVPQEDPSHAANAVAAALSLRRELAAINATRERPVRIGMGVHTGVVAAGALGGLEQHEYTVIGDAVNVASRIEGLTKVHAVDLLVSESTWSQTGGAFSGARVAEQPVKGRAAPIVIWSVSDQPADVAA